MQAHTISIHAPGWGATPVEVRSTIFFPYFNPRTRVGCDPGAPHIFPVLFAISIHAPGWGATSSLRR